MASINKGSGWVELRKVDPCPSGLRQTDVTVSPLTMADVIYVYMNVGAYS